MNVKQNQAISIFCYVFVRWQWSQPLTIVIFIIYMNKHLPIYLVYAVVKLNIFATFVRKVSQS